MGRALAFAAIALVASGLSAVATDSLADDLGAYGATFRIKEIDLFEMLRAKLMAAQKSGKIEELNKAFAARVIKGVNRPRPVGSPGSGPVSGPGAPVLTKATANHTWLFDPSVTVPKDFADQNGRVFARAGDVINPLDRIPTYRRVLIFIDGDDADQVKFAVGRYKANPQQVKVILTNGAPLNLMRREKIEMYFDQTGSLTAKFGFRHIPAVVERDGRALRISEVRL
ncbi:MAG: type-F conjugative transfer system protein TraW [Asticcacaulis sp. 32-58-5]|nr:MAG: type-F conjugative transfer system protein TraW [Asticcacaulis sp. 32-58-5]